MAHLAQPDEHIPAEAVRMATLCMSVIIHCPSLGGAGSAASSPWVHPTAPGSGAHMFAVCLGGCYDITAPPVPALQAVH